MASIVNGRYVRFALSAMLSMFLGSQIVHTYYMPLKDMNTYIEEELRKLPEEQRNKIKL